MCACISVNNIMGNSIKWHFSWTLLFCSYSIVLFFSPKRAVKENIKEKERVWWNNLGTNETDKRIEKSVVKHERTLLDVSVCVCVQCSWRKTIRKRFNERKRRIFKFQLFQIKKFVVCLLLSALVKYGKFTGCRIKRRVARFFFIEM